MPNRDHAMLKLPDASDGLRPARFDDRPLMLLGSLAFGLAIPWLTGLYGALTPMDVHTLNSMANVQISAGIDPLFVVVKDTGRQVATALSP